jgi:hypothetical protein
VFAKTMKIMGWKVWSCRNKGGGYEIHDYSNDYNIPVLTLINYNVLCKYDLRW